MLGFLLNRFRERKAVRCLESAAQSGQESNVALVAARDLGEIGTARSIPALCYTLARGPVALRSVAAIALASIYKRHSDDRALDALNTAILHENEPEEVRVVAIEALADVVHVRHVGSLIKLVRPGGHSPARVRTAAIRALQRLGYPEVVERLVEVFLFRTDRDDSEATRRWAVEELVALTDPEKLSKIHEILQHRRKLRYYAVSVEAGHPADLVHLMATVDPRQAVRYLNHMVDHSTKIISVAAVAALRAIRRKQDEHETRIGTSAAPQPRSGHAGPAPPKP